MTTTQKAVVELLDNEFGVDELELDDPIFSAKVLDSMDVLRLIVLIEQEFGVKIPVFEVSLEMFDSINSITSVIEKFRKG